MELSGKVAIVTGASRGLGKIYASALAQAGAAVAVTARMEQVDSARPAVVPTAGETPAGRPWCRRERCRAPSIGPSRK
jgi:NAD(P)-dependent dehydrogenase (short-subunit alcohol dehydrogenase family)